MWFRFTILLLVGSACEGDSHHHNQDVKPNIVFIIADDMGWNDVSYHGSDQILTPNIDSLAMTGISFSRYYTNCQCTPSRSALLTGKYAYKLGMQGYPLTNAEDRGIPVKEKLLPQYLKEVGYATHLIGKWHVGRSREAYLPLNRGFDSYYGFLGGLVDYFEFEDTETWGSEPVSGYDFYAGNNVLRDVKGYLTDVLTERTVKVIREHNVSKPLFVILAHGAPHSGTQSSLMQPLPENVRANSHIELLQRRQYAGVVKSLDDSVGTVVLALAEKEILNNTIIIFISDNGGETQGLSSSNYASNFPLRGTKMSPWEGGVRVPAFIWTKHLKEPFVWDGYFHITDWLPTLLSASNLTIPIDIDGLNQWKVVNRNKESARNEIVVEIDDYTGYSALIKGNYKLVTGNPNVALSQYLAADLRGVTKSPPNYMDSLQSSKTYSAFMANGKIVDVLKVDSLRKKFKIVCKNCTSDCFPSNDKSCLFNIQDDPCETKDVSNELPELLLEMSVYLSREYNRRIPRTVPLFRDPFGKPDRHNYTWSNGWYDKLHDGL